MADSAQQGLSGGEPGPGKKKDAPQQEANTPGEAYCERLLAEYVRLYGKHQLLGILPKSYRGDDAPELASMGEINAWWVPGSQRWDPKYFRERLIASARIQAAVMDITSYSPSKWLLEQEMQARRKDPSDPSGDEATWTPLRKGGQTNYVDVYEAAWNALADSSAGGRRGLVGLAFSGGGIRSATFCLGVLQELARRKLLHQFDYLSSVSGGGYIHQWFASWVLRDKNDDSLPGGETPGIDRVSSLLVPQPDAEAVARTPAQISWLRRYSSYLTPRRGIFSADTWTMLATWFRNTFLNQIVLLSFLALAVLTVRALARLAVRDSQLDYLVPCCCVLALLAVPPVCAWFVWQAITSLTAQPPGQNDRDPAPQEAERHYALGDCGVFCVVAFVFGTCILASAAHFFWWGVPYFAACLGLWPARFSKQWRLARCVVPLVLVVLLLYISSLRISAQQALQVPYKTIECVAQKVAERANNFIYSPAPAAPKPQPVTLKSDTVSGFALSSQVNVIAPAAVSNARPCAASGWHPTVSAANLLAIFIPLLWMAFVFTYLRIELGLLSTSTAESEREWVARFGAWAAMVSAAWLVIGVIGLLGPALLKWLFSGSAVKLIAAIAAFLAAHAATLYSGASSKTNGNPTAKSGLFGYSWLELVGMVGAPLCIVLLLIATSGFVDWVIHGHGGVAWRNGLGLGIGLAVVFVLFALRVDINAFSMHGFYRNRLARCYLGATNPKRSPDPFTGLDDRETGSLANESGGGHALADFRPERFGLEPKTEAGTTTEASPNAKPKYTGPFPIFSSTLSLNFGQDLAWQERKGASFAFTPLYSGYSVGWTADAGKGQVRMNGFLPTAHFAYPDNGIRISAAAAISGAAMNPNQGVNTQPALAFLMTLFNVRLGWWMANPRTAVWRERTDVWGAKSKKGKYWCLLRELFGLADDTASYVALSDGGQFENMGLYELVRRRVRYIVVCDAECDKGPVLNGIGLAIEKCRVDFGVEIELDLNSFLHKDGNGAVEAQKPYAFGNIYYPAPPGSPAKYCGRILYIKNVLSPGALKAGDILHHSLANPQFPNDSTTNQWFNETLFESYRRLGQANAAMAFGDPGSFFEHKPLNW